MIDLDDMSTWDRPLFPLSVVAEGAGIKLATLRKWYDRDRLDPASAPFALIGGGETTVVPGQARLLSFRMALHVAVMAALTKAGVEPADAYGAAVHWVHVGDSASGWGDGPLPKPEREPAGLYTGDGVWTILVHFAGKDAVVTKAKVEDGQVRFEIADLMFQQQTLSLPPKLVFLNTIQAFVWRACQGYLSKLD